MKRDEQVGRERHEGEYNHETTDKSPSSLHRDGGVRDESSHVLNEEDLCEKEGEENAKSATPFNLFVFPPNLDSRPKVASMRIILGMIGPPKLPPNALMLARKR